MFIVLWFVNWALSNLNVNCFIFIVASNEKTACDKLMYNKEIIPQGCAPMPKILGKNIKKSAFGLLLALNTIQNFQPQTFCFHPGEGKS